jgi:hypothetical protein
VEHCTQLSETEENTVNNSERRNVLRQSEMDINAIMNAVDINMNVRDVSAAHDKAKHCLA